MTTLAICLVNHNAGELTLRCLRSIAKYHPGGLEIIVVDNASSDGSAALIAKNFSGVRIIANDRNSGFAAANDLAIRATTAKYIVLLNNDMELVNDALGELRSFMENNPKIGIATCRLYDADGKTVQRNCRSFPLTPFDTMFGRASLLSRVFPNNPLTRKNLLSDWGYNSPRRVDWVSGACMMVRREVFDRIGLLDENYFMYWEDTDFCKRASDAGWEIWFTPAGEIIHYTGQGGGERSLPLKLNMIWQLHRSAYYYFRKHYYKSPLNPMAIIALLGMIGLVGAKSLTVIFKEYLPIK